MTTTGTAAAGPTVSDTPAGPSRSTPVPLLPAYGRSTLADLLPSVGHHLGVPGCDADVLGLPAANRYVVLLVDGLGHDLVVRAADRAPWLSARLGDRPLTSGVPATTVTSLTSLGTGLPPGQHGMVGITSRVPSTGEVLNALSWESDLLPETCQPYPTMFERAAAGGFTVTHLDCTLICEAPKIGPHAAAMRAALAAITALSPDRISVKATTSERLGFTGRGEGIAAQAAVSILVPA